MRGMFSLLFHSTHIIGQNTAKKMPEPMSGEGKIFTMLPGRETGMGDTYLEIGDNPQILGIWHFSVFCRIPL